MTGAISESPMAKRLEGNVAIITGGASGIGESTARLFVKHGAKVIVADVQDDLGHGLCNELNQIGIKSYVHCDVSDDSYVKNLGDIAVAKYGQLNIMYNNAGITGNIDYTILGFTKENFKRVFDVNVYGSFSSAKHAAAVMIPAKKGVILFTSSISSLSCSESPHGVEACDVGFDEESMRGAGTVRDQSELYLTLRHSHAATRNRHGDGEGDVGGFDLCVGCFERVVPKAEDVAEAALFLGSDESQCVTGLMHY